MKHAKPKTAYTRMLLAAMAAVALIASLFGGVVAIANNQATAPTQQTRGVTASCTLTNSMCTVAHGLGTTPTSVVAIPWGAGQNATLVAKDDTNYTLRFLWHDGKKFANGTVIKYDVTFDYIGEPVDPTTSPTVSPTPTVTPTTDPSNPTPTPTATVTPTQTPTVSPTNTLPPNGTTCNPTNTIAHFTGEGSDAIGDAPATEKPGQYNISAEQWAVKNDYSSNLCAYSKDNWYVDIKATDHGDGAVQAYPSIRKIYHDWALGGNFSKDPKLSTFPQLKASVAVTDPTNCTGCKYNDAFDIWINGIGNGTGVTEMMIWTHNNGQFPAGSHRKIVNIGGISWDVFTADWGYIAYVPRDNLDLKSGTYDLKAFIQDSVASGYITTPDPSIGQVSYGVEPVSTGGVFKRWTFSNFTIADK